jgi:hypothetical protein
MPIKDKTGMIFGYLAVIKLSNKRNVSNTSYWWCKCKCGNKILVRSDSLTSGNTKSCGCLFKEVHTKHSMYGTPEYDAYYHMLHRCHNPDSQKFKDYGGRGITVCKRWQDSNKGFQNFLDDMGEKPYSNYQLDRQNNDKGYSPNNCRWVSPRKNSNNTRTNVRIKFAGKTRTVAEWARQYGMSWSTLNTRLSKGWSVKKSLTTPIRHKSDSCWT